MQSLAPKAGPSCSRRSRDDAAAAVPTDGKPAEPPTRDPRPLVVIDPGHGGIDNGTKAERRNGKGHRAGICPGAARTLEKSGKYRVVMTRTDDTFIPLGERVKFAAPRAALFVSIHADAIPRREGDAQGATVYTLSDKRLRRRSGAAGRGREPRRRHCRR